MNPLGLHDDLCPLFSLHGDKVEKTPLSFNVIIILINCIFAMTTSIPNLLIAFVIIKRSTLRSPANIFLASQASINVVVFLLAHPTLIALQTEEIVDSIGKGYCSAQLLNLSSSVICILLSFLSVFGMALNQYLDLRFPSWYSRAVTTKNVIAMCIFIWLFVVSTTTMCAVLGIAQYFFVIAIIAAVSVMFFAIVFNVKSYFKIRKYMMQVQQQLETPNTNVPEINAPDITRHQKTSALVSCIVATCFLTHAPLFITFVSAYATGWSSSTKTSFLISLTVACGSSILNAAIYLRWNEDLRQAVFHILGLNN